MIFVSGLPLVVSCVAADSVGQLQRRRLGPSSSQRMDAYLVGLIANLSMYFPETPLLYLGCTSPIGVDGIGGVLTVLN